MGKVRAKEA
jgi:hypothetical protein